LTITNDGCTADQVLDLKIGSKITNVLTQINVSCKGDATGSVTITPSGGTGPYSILEEQTNLAAGDYTFTIVDANNCTATVDVTITEPDLLEAKLVGPILQEVCVGNEDGAFSIEVSGGNMPYSYSLDNRNGPFLKGELNQTIFDFTNLPGGKHIVYIKDATGCTDEIEVHMDDAVVLEPKSEVSYVCANNSAENFVTITIDASIKNSGDIDYALDSGEYQSSNVFVNVAPGRHTVTARHLRGCEQKTVPFTIDDIQPLTLVLSNGELNEIVATATGGSGVYQYTFDNEAYTVTNKFIIYKSGVYTVTVTDQNGCTATASMSFEYVDVCIPNYFTPNGDGINDEWGPDCTINYKNLTYTIFDRYGRIIAEYKLGQKWDGKYKGVELSSGDYWYVLKLNNNKDNREFVGHFTLYR
ncbi:T9SS type B sorting domain-containing protein, partial [Flavobacterium sp. AJR]